MQSKHGHTGSVASIEFLVLLALLEFFGLINLMELLLAYWHQTLQKKKYYYLNPNPEICLNVRQ